MSRACNSVVLVGRLTSDVEIRQAGDNIVANFIVAINRPKSGDREPEADFIPCQLWGKRAETFAQYHHKGSGCNVCGEIRVDKYEKDGMTKIFTKVHVTDFAFIPSNKFTQSMDADKKNENYEESKQSYTRNEIAETATLDIESDDLPF